jgi:photosystem II stability/assembly factor-like uncharacterized protein
MKKIISAITIAILLFAFNMLQAQWTQVNTGITKNILKISQFDNGRIICATANGSVLMSDDSGDTWTEIPVTSEPLVAIDCINGTAIALSFYGEIHMSNNYGESWQYLNYYGIELRDIEFHSESKAYIAGANEMALESQNHFSYWNLIPYIIGDGYWLRNFEFFDQQNGFLVGDGGEAFKTPNSGYGWFKMDTQTTENLQAVFFPSADTGYIVGNNNTILKTTDGGITWNNVYTGSLGTFLDAYFVSNTEGYVAGNNGVIIHTEDGGETWQQEATGVSTMLFYFCYHQESNRLLLTGADGVLLYKDLAVGTDDNISKKTISGPVTVAPNPAQNKVSFQFTNPNNAKQTLLVYNSTGKLLTHADIAPAQGMFNLDVRTFPAGLYHYSLINDTEKLHSGTFIKQ